MKLIPNIGPMTRVAYVVFGAGLIALGLLAPFLRSPWPVLACLFGAIVMVEGAVGF